MSKSIATQLHETAVETLQTLSVRLSKPSKGWLKVVLQLNGCRVETSASEVSNDPIEELVDLVLFLRAATSGVRRVCFWEEGPDSYVLEVVACPAGKFELRLYRDPELFVPDLSDEAVLVVRVNGIKEQVLNGLASEVQRLSEDMAGMAGADWRGSDPGIYAKRLNG